MKLIDVLLASLLAAGCHGADSAPPASAPAYAPTGHPPPGAATQTRPATVATTALALGAPAPAIDARLPDHDVVVVVFYRGDWCPFCRAQLADLQQHDAEFRQRRAAIAAVAVDGAETAAHLGSALHLTYALVPDPRHALIAAFGVYDATNELAWPSVFVVGRDGTIAWRWLADDFKHRVSAAEVLAAIDRLVPAPR